MIELTGGRFWAPYKAVATAPADKSQPSPGGMPASLYRYRAPIDLSSPQLRKLARALGPAYIRISGTWANSTYFQDSDGPAPEKPPVGFNAVLTRAIRAHANFAEYAPLALLMLATLALTNTAALPIHVLGVALTLGRALHAVGMMRERHPNVLRFTGSLLTVLVLSLGGVLCLLRFYEALTA